jgi:hypothetical protein
MANFITTSIVWEGKENFEKLLRPLFVGRDPMTTQGIRIMPNIQSKTKLNLWGAVRKVLKAYAKGFNPATGSVFTQRDIDVYQMKAEMAQDANEFYQTVYEQLLAKGVDWNDISKASGQLQDAIIEIFMNAFKSDVYRQYWLNDTYKETVSGGFYTGTADVDYNAYKGLWQIIFENASATPTADQIQAFDYDASAVAQVQTVTFTGTSGTANVTVDGVNYLATFDTDLDTTAANFVTLHASALLNRKLLLENQPTGDDARFTSTIPGRPFSTITITNVSGDLAGSVAATTANTAPVALTEDQAVGVLKTMYKDSPATLKTLSAREKVFLVDGDTYENYLSTVEGWGSSVKFSSERGRIELINGREFLTYRGIPVVNLDWENDLNADFAHASGENPARPYRIIYTALNNLVMAIDAMSEFTKFEFWYNKDEQENRYRMQLKTGANYVHNELMSVAYEL